MRERLQRWGGYTLGIVVEVAVVFALSVLGLLVMYLVKVIAA